MEAGIATRQNAILRIASYNVLAQCLAKSSYFTYAEKATLKWANRSKALAAVVPGLGDVICLSEVDYVPHWRTALEPEFVLLHQMRGAKQYGQAIAYRRNKFRLVDAATCNFDDIADAAGGEVADLHRRACVAMFAALQLVPPSSPQSAAAAELAAPPGPLVIVASTHLFWDPVLPPVRAAQAGMLQHCLADFVNRALARTGPRGAGPVVVIAGDLNSLPGSVAHRVLTQHPLPQPWGEAAGPQSPPPWSSGWDRLLHAGGEGATGFPPDARPPVEAVAPAAREAWLAEVSRALPSWLAHVDADAGRPPSPPAGSGADCGAGAAVPAPVTPSAAEALSASSPPPLAAGDRVRVLRSAYAWHQAGDALASASYAAACAAEPPLTTATDSFRGTLDYVLVSPPPPTAAAPAPSCTWRVSAVRALPGPDDAVPPMPNSACPSDHFPVSADLDLVW